MYCSIYTLFHDNSSLCFAAHVLTADRYHFCGTEIIATQKYAIVFDLLAGLPSMLLN